MPATQVTGPTATKPGVIEEINLQMSQSGGLQ